jgi:hypothetical protein
VSSCSQDPVTKSGTYVQCSQCGKRALSIATRCPHCGNEFPSRPPAPARRPLDLRRSLAVAGAAAALIVLVMVVSGRIRKTPAEHPTSVVAAVPDTTIVAASPPASPGERRFARTWTTVRTRRSITGDVAAVLLPGDTVLVDSLSRGWWRVTLQGKVLGYVHRSTVDTVLPAPRP